MYSKLNVLYKQGELEMRTGWCSVAYSGLGSLHNRNGTMVLNSLSLAVIIMPILRTNILADSMALSQSILNWETGV